MHVVSMQGIPGLSGEKGRLGLPGEKVQKQKSFTVSFFTKIKSGGNKVKSDPKGTRLLVQNCPKRISGLYLH